ncbi:heme NO-binding domain-containing protein [Oceanicoccus sagamiensis]|uniref:Heme NO-binding domain-containing protein n=1 Tax=Oceanicoccus sagamiensis TaxID=716816 RepID=A0A1X9N665_9GAMM|nr:heme NO-binding domain-containing protein [Oceanicoccus sagamiensis]ARN73216.1 hypothetical protein BST96_03300 [Oceanicoccus sagamiensis]
MKGIVYTLFQDMVEDEFGLEVWELLIEQSSLASEGIYTSVKTYPDEEMVQLITQLSAHTGTPAPALIEHFGHYLLPNLMGTLPATISRYSDLWSFMSAIDDVIHLEVQKLNPDALTPEIRVLEHQGDHMDVSYQSPRKLCFLAIGLIKQAGLHFNTPVDVAHKQCMHDDHTNCVLSIHLSE